ncbi:MAG: hypothetical protein AVDCRST_MAG75-1611 [uncultured Propionibacteriaceae bacterium]|uniref:YbjN domain-containing protein n=1 Tax=uncultured Propionibacteriaceae bacterium TaxID=257457 RepID=A0A6J4NM24_9ACTN|nr:MAG: hypothetical protein AVDCRST_MAG75-1611 [uncultured Propionibacteriaceae bacterium]
MTINEYFDIDRSTTQAWDEFQARLSEVISVMDDSEDLTIGTESESEDPAPFITFRSPALNRVRCEAASNLVLGEDFQLSPEQLSTMEESGWHPPTSDGSGQCSNFWVEDSQEESHRLSELAVGALRDVYGVQHPVFLSPDQLAEVLKPKPEPIPGRFQVHDVVATVPGSQEHLNFLVDRELSEMFGHRPIRDAEGDIAIRVGSTMLFLRVSADGFEILVFATVVHDVSGRSRATEVLNDLNVDARWVKFQLIRDRVFVTLSVPARPFVPAHLHQAVRIMSQVADGIDEELASKLNGRTTFGDEST